MALNSSPKGDEIKDDLDKDGKTNNSSNIIGNVSRF